MNDHLSLAGILARIGIILAMAGSMALGAARAQAPCSDLPPAEGLTLQTLIDRAQRCAAGPRVADREVAVARQRAVATDAALRPHLSAGATATRETVNPDTLGLAFPGLPSLIGPFGVFDARLRLSQAVIDLAQISAASAADAAVRAAQARADLDREHLASEVALAFIRALAARENLASTEADLRLAMELDTLAHDQHAAGVASGVDLLRAQTAVAQSRYTRSEAQTLLARSQLRLQGLSELPLDPAALTLQGELAAAAVDETPGPEAALAQARRDRPEFALLDAALAEAEARYAQASRRRLPTLSLVADYGLSTTTDRWDQQDTYRIGAQLSLPIYAGGALQADRAASELRIEQQRLQLAALQRQVEEDVLLAVVTVGNTAEQARAAHAALELAQRELASARDRFQHGVADNLDVVAAQANLARARSQLVNAQAAQQQARLNLAAATGHASGFGL